MVAMAFHLWRDDIHFVDHVKDQVEDSLLLEQVLPVPQCFQELLSIFVAEMKYLSIFSFKNIFFAQREIFQPFSSLLSPEILLWLDKVVVQIVQAAHLF